LESRLDQADVAHDQSSNGRLLSDAPNDIRCCVQRIGSADRRVHVHDQQISVTGKVDEFRVGAVLIGAEDEYASRDSASIESDSEFGCVGLYHVQVNSAAKMISADVRKWPDTEAMESAIDFGPLGESGRDLLTVSSSGLTQSRSFAGRLFI
jgi:hypothetical protein